jgi:hypothetical protein
LEGWIGVSQVKKGLTESVKVREARVLTDTPLWVRGRVVRKAGSWD